MTSDVSFWRRNISETVDHFTEFGKVSAMEAANIIAADAIHILVDLNGHTKNSGLPIMAYRPAPVQVTNYVVTVVTAVHAPTSRVRSLHRFRI